MKILPSRLFRFNALNIIHKVYQVATIGIANPGRSGKGYEIINRFCIRLYHLANRHLLYI